jgi:hypothetical protein
MTYEPRLIVEKKDLESIRDMIDNLKEKDTDLQKYLLEVLTYYPCRFKGHRLITFQPEFSNFNLKVRKFLDKYDVEYGENN